MAENAIDNLSIQVTASAENAARVFDRLASSAGHLRGAAQGAGGGMRDMAHGARDVGTATQQAGAQSGRARPNIRGVGKDAKDAGDNAKKGASGLATFWGALRRIAYYRFIRSVIRGITDAFKTGITNLYQWSSAVNGTFAKSMDRIATSTLYLKNSLGAMLAPLINTLAPVIEWIVDRIVDVINWINKLFAALSGSQTYTVAKKVATTWADAGKSAAGSAKKAADDIKRTILGFDEINKLEKQNIGSYGGSGGSATSGPNYSDMFEERKLDGWMSKLAAFIDKFNLRIPAVFAGLLAGWAAVRLAVKGVAALTKGWLRALSGKVISVAVSLVRKGWSTLKAWVLKFGEAVVDLAVRIKTSVVGLWTRFALKWAALNPVLKVGIVASTTALALWLAYRLAWAKSPGKVLQIKAAIKTAAKELWEALKKDWVPVAAAGLAVAVVLSPRASLMAIGLFAKLAAAWAVLSPTLKVGIVISTTAAALWALYKLAWALVPEKVLSIKAAISNTAQELWNDIQNGWATVKDKVLRVSVRPEIEAANKNVVTGEKSFSGVGSWKGADPGYLPGDENPFTVSQLFGALSGTNIKDIGKTIGTVAAGVASVLLAGGLFAGGASTSAYSMFMPGLNGSLDKSPLSPKSTYYNNLSGELIVPNKQSVDVVVNAKPGVGLSRKSAYSMVPNVENTSSTNTVAGNPGASMERVQNNSGALAPKVANVTSTDTVSARVGMGMRNRARGGGMESIVHDTNTTNTVFAVRGWFGNLTKFLGIDALSSTVQIKTQTPWQYHHKSALQWLGLSNLTATVTVVAKVAAGIGNFIRTSIVGRANGGIYAGGSWRDIPAYANGTTNARGSLFVAGEAGPEIVGHVGGRTEVLNKSQLASAMYSAVQAAMAPASANFAAAAANMGVAETVFDFEMLADIVRQGVEQAMSRSNDYDRQKVELLRSINDKDFSVDISTASINNAQSRMNRRAGTTVVPVGT